MMNRILIPLAILIGSLLYSWFWNCERRPHCFSGEYTHESEAVVPVVPIEPEPITTDTVMTVEEQEELLFEPLDVYFETGKESITRNEEIDRFISTAKEYLKANEGKKLSLVGHTDNDGSDATNDPLSVKRADKMKEFLVAQGFDPAQLETSGRGEREPIASNDTPEGRAKNRRVTIRLAK